MGIINKLGGNFAQGLMGNLSEQTPEKLASEYGAYLTLNIHGLFYRVQNPFCFQRF